MNKEEFGLTLGIVGWVIIIICVALDTGETKMTLASTIALIAYGIGTWGMGFATGRDD